MPAKWHLVVDLKRRVRSEMSGMTDWTTDRPRADSPVGTGPSVWPGDWTTCAIASDKDKFNCTDNIHEILLRQWTPAEVWPQSQRRLDPLATKTLQSTNKKKRQRRVPAWYAVVPSSCRPSVSGVNSKLGHTPTSRVYARRAPFSRDFWRPVTFWTITFQTITFSMQNYKIGESVAHALGIGAYRIQIPGWETFTPILLFRVPTGFCSKIPRLFPDFSCHGMIISLTLF